MHDAKLKAQATYNSAADYYDNPALAFWERFGRATVERLNLQPGASVLDVCSGAGASAIPAARGVGPTGSVLAVDLAENLLVLAEGKARQLGLTNLEFRVSDVDALNFSPERFDAVVIVFGIFFLPDMVETLTRLWRFVKPHGQLAVTTWGPRLWEPGSSLFWSAVDDVRPDLTRAYNPWDSLTDPEAVRALLLSAGIRDVTVEPVSGTHPLRSPEDFWSIVLGSGYRATFDALTEMEQRSVHAQVLHSIEEHHITNVETNVVYATARKS